MVLNLLRRGQPVERISVPPRSNPPYYLLAGRLAEQLLEFDHLVQQVGSAEFYQLIFCRSFAPN